MEFFVIGLLAMAVIISVIADDRRIENDRRRIIAYLHEKGATQIYVVRTWDGGDRDTNTYNATYVDVNGQLHHNRCKIRSSMLITNPDIYWKDPL